MSKGKRRACALATEAGAECAKSDRRSFDCAALQFTMTGFVLNAFALAACANAYSSSGSNTTSAARSSSFVSRIINNPTSVSAATEVK